MIDHIENKFVKYWIEDDILYTVYKDGASIDLSGAIKIVKDRLFLQQGKDFLIYCDLRGVKSVNKSARNYFALEGSVLIKAVALLVNPPLTSAISGFFLKANNPAFKIQIFTEKEDAIEFLNNIKTID
ncbi:DUF7793 family protein [Flavivirga eckloniae]|uniref:DUF7793 domain-containing protein n=1 Tax=Flavivirga eckloniae TaxID=1803846 RepID=A0A2K9PNU2_9FLAO|nr:hypothetical protein [Flavivirga eckloniae]AUP78706.1 hypothetical protein C1H87_08295 [Flavivirga eckloniae]